MEKYLITMKKYLIIYHREDNDGVFSAAIAESYIRKISNNDAYNDVIVDRLPSDYVSLSKITNKDINKWQKEYDYIIMTDISFSDSDKMKYMFSKFGNNFIWIDHHMPAIKSSFAGGYDIVAGERDNKHSAILLAFKYFYDPFNEYNSKLYNVKLFRILSAWDSFTYEQEGYTLEYVRDVNKGATEKYMLNYTDVYEFVDTYINKWLFDKSNRDFKTLDSFIVHELETIGHDYNAYDDRRNENIVNNDGDMSWTVNGRPACALFSHGATNSLMFRSVADKVRNGIVFKHKPDGNWVMSLYNTNVDDKFHCGEYLKEKYSGGGHSGAAGCTLSQDKFIELLTSKSI